MSEETNIRTEPAAPPPADAPPEVGLVYGMPNEVYHSLPAVSNSQLKALRKSPHHFHARHVHRVPSLFADDDEGSDSMFAGTLAHCATLEPAEFDQRYVVGPNVKTRASKEWREFVAANPKRVAITPRQHQTAMLQAASVHAHADVREVLEHGRCEVSAFWKDAATGILCRCRPDMVNDTFGDERDRLAIILDLKTTTDASLEAISATVQRYGYHHQAEHYIRGFRAASGVQRVGFLFAFVENAYPFASRVVQLSDVAMTIAARENRAALELLARCRREGSWPGYPSGVDTVTLPRWELLKHDDL